MTELTLDRMREVATRRGVEALRFAKAWLERPEDLRPRPLFVVGCQRSGTTMLIDTLQKSPTVWSHPEKSWLAYDAFRLRSPETVRRITEATPASVVVYKPLCDSHLTDRILDEHPEARAFWVWRRWPDVVNSAVHKWGDHQVEVVRGIAEGRFDELGWRGERLDDAIVATIRRLWHEGMNPHTGAALQWWLRNGFYFSLGLDDDPRVRLIRYEDLVEDPARMFHEVFDFLESPWDPAYVADIVPTSVGLRPPPPVDPEVAELCDAMTRRLEASGRAAGVA